MNVLMILFLQLLDQEEDKDKLQLVGLEVEVEVEIELDLLVVLRKKYQKETKRNALKEERCEKINANYYNNLIINIFSYKMV